LKAVRYVKGSGIVIDDVCRGSNSGGPMRLRSRSDGVMSECWNQGCLRQDAIWSRCIHRRRVLTRVLTPLLLFLFSCLGCRFPLFLDLFNQIIELSDRLVVVLRQFIVLLRQGIAFFCNRFEGGILGLDRLILL